MNEAFNSGLAAPFRPDDASRQFWLRSLEASWRFERMRTEDTPPDLDWGYLSWMAAYHRVLEDMIRVWEPVPGMPSVLQDAFWFRSKNAERLGRQIEDAVDYLDDVCGALGIAVVVMKSPAYVPAVFGSYTFRDVRDLDVFSSQADFFRLTERLKADGFTFQDWRSQRVFDRDQLRVEFHHQVLSRKRHKNLLCKERLLERAVPLDGTRQLLRLADLDEIVLLALHARNHDFRRLIWLRDIPAWWRVRNPDPGAVLARFKELGVERTGWIVWRGMQKMGWPMPESWIPEVWGVLPQLDCRIQDYWQAYYRDSGVTLPVELSWRRVEFGEGRGLVGKMETVAPWLAWKRMDQIKMACRASMRRQVIGCGA